MKLNKITEQGYHLGQGALPNHVKCSWRNISDQKSARIIMYKVASIRNFFLLKSRLRLNNNTTTLLSI